MDSSQSYVVLQYLKYLLCNKILSGTSIAFLDYPGHYCLTVTRMSIPGLVWPNRDVWSPWVCYPFIWRFVLFSTAWWAFFVFQMKINVLMYVAVTATNDKNLPTIPRWKLQNAIIMYCIVTWINKLAYFFVAHTLFLALPCRSCWCMIVI